MKYNNITKGKLIKRLNRFVALVEINGLEELTHIKNTGRCAELLLPGYTVYLTKSNNSSRKTKYDLISVFKEDGRKIVNIDSQIPNALTEEWLRRSNLFTKTAKFKREVFYKNSRFDIYVEDNDRKVFIEVKGVTLEKDTTALFPDAPTERGVKHLKELIYAVEDGYEAYVIFVIQMKGPKSFSPNKNTHKEFAEALTAASRKGVKILAVDCFVTRDSIRIDQVINVIL